jgi:hypothetical protein
MIAKKRSKKKPARAHGRGRALAGWREYIALPALGIGPLIAKLDTGARSAALHAENIEIYQKNGHSRIRFDVPLDSHSKTVKSCDLLLSDQRRVKNTGGRSELRQVVETELQLGEVSWQAQITLTNRTDMGVPMLLGRNTIKGRFLVHPGRSFMLSGAAEGKRSGERR